MKKKCELLAPAGGMEQLKAAVENGADAVYLGGRLFNARINASNFEDAELAEAVRYAHLRNVQVYVTMNILLYNEELQEALEYAAYLYQIGVDALIVQDLGLAELLREHLPNFPLHLSTQGTVYNLSGVRSAEKLGFCRVVPSRELSLTEIKEITSHTACELEVFCHGALCICYSGQCHMSRLFGGRSGNRGQCGQPCRLKYTDENGKSGYFLSPRDLCTVDILDKLIEAGVSSLKIEGRMKSAEYVATVVRIYRKYLDQYYENGSYTVKKQDMDDLRQIFCRGDFTHGYLTGSPGRSMMAENLPKHSGIAIGTVTSCRRGSTLVDVQLFDTLEMGDGVEIRGSNRTGNVISYLKQIGTDTWRIGDIKEKVVPGDQVYRISSKKLLERARRDSRENTRQIPVDMAFTCRVGEVPSLTVREGHNTVTVQGNGVAEQAKNRPSEADRIETQLRKTGGTPFAVQACVVTVDGVCIVPISQINQMRRNVLEQLEQLKTKPRESVNIEEIPLLEPDIQTGEGQVYPTITKGKMDDYIATHIGGGAVTLNNLGWIQEFKEAGATVYGGHGLNVVNGYAVKALARLGVTVTELSDELRQEDVCVMTTEYDVPCKTLTNSRGMRYQIVKEPDESQCRIYPIES